MTLPPTSPPAIVRCGDTPVLQSPDDRREQHKRKPRLISDIHVGQPGTKDRTQREAHGPSQARGVHWGRTAETAPSAIATAHGSYRLLSTQQRHSWDRRDSPRSTMPRHDLDVRRKIVLGGQVHSPTKERPGGVVHDPNPTRIWPSTARSDEWPAWFPFWFSGCWRALAKGTAWAGFIGQFIIITELGILLPPAPR